MYVFEKPGKLNTQKACEIAVETAMKSGMDIVASTTEGYAGKTLCEISSSKGFSGRIVIVTHCYGSREPGKNALTQENRIAIEKHGAVLVTAAHALSGAERGISSRFSGIYPAEIIAQSLRMLSQGIKVVVEIGAMALDAGVITYGNPIVCMGGTGHGLDTAVVMDPAYSSHIFESNIHEIICMPY